MNADDSSANKPPPSPHADSAHELPEDLAALYAAGAMSDEEQEQFESHLEQEPSLRRALATYHGVREMLIAQIQPVTPDRRIRRVLMGRIKNEQSEGVAAPSQPVDSSDGDTSTVLRRADDQDWRETGASGVQVRVLFADKERGRMTVLMRGEPGAVFPSHAHEQPEELMVLKGDLDFGDYVLREGDYLRLAAGTHHQTAQSKMGCLCLLTTALVPALVV